MSSPWCQFPGTSPRIAAVRVAVARDAGDREDVVREAERRRRPSTGRRRGGACGRGASASSAWPASWPGAAPASSCGALRAGGAVGRRDLRRRSPSPSDRCGTTLDGASCANPIRITVPAGEACVRLRQVDGERARLRRVRLRERDDVTPRADDDLPPGKRRDDRLADGEPGDRRGLARRCRHARSSSTLRIVAAPPKSDSEPTTARARALGPAAAAAQADR